MVVQGELQFFTKEDIDRINSSFDELVEKDEAIEMLGFDSISEYVENAPVIAAFMAMNRLNMGALLYGFCAMCITNSDAPEDVLLDKRLSVHALGYAMVYMRAALNIMDREELTLNAFDIGDFVNNPPVLTDVNEGDHTVADLARSIEDEVDALFLQMKEADSD